MEPGFVRGGKPAVLLLAGILLLSVSVLAATGNIDVSISSTNGTYVSGTVGFSSTTNSSTGNVTWQYHNGSQWVDVCTNTTYGTSFSNTSCDVSGIAEGYYNFSAVANITDDNESRSDYLNLTVDNNAPDVDFASNNPTQSNWTNDSTVTFNVTIADNNTQSCIFEMNHSAWASAVNYTNTSSGGSCSYYFSDLGDGNWTYTAWANDSASNYNSTGTRWLVVETELPSVTVHTPGSDNLSSVPVLFNFTVVDEVESNFTCYVWFNGSLVNTSYPLNNTPTEFSISGLDRGDQTWEINCSDANYTYASGNTTFGLYPNVAIEDFWWEKLPHNNTAPGDTINATVLINLTGSFNLTDNVTVRIRLDSEEWESPQNVSNSTLTTEDSSLIVNFIDNITVTDAGDFVLTAQVVMYELQSNSSDNTATADGYAGYIVELANVCYGGTCTYNNTNGNEAFVPPGENVTLNVSVQYPNSTTGDEWYVTGLSSEDFNVYNRKDSGSVPYNPSWSNSSMSSFGSGGATGHYKFDYTIPDLEWGSNYHNLADAPGRYYLYVNISDGSSYNLASGDYALYNISAGYLTLSYTIPSDVKDLEGEDYKVAYFNLTVSNAYGTADLQEIHFTEAESDGIEAFYFGVYDGSPDCEEVNVTTLAGGSTNTSCRMRIKTSSTGDDEWTNITAIGYDAEGNMYYYSLKKTFDIDDSSSTSDPDGDSPGGTPSGGDDFNFAVSITDYPSKVYAYPGGGNKTNVTIKNSGDTVLVAKLKVTASGIIDSTTITPVSYSLSPGSSWNFTLDFTLASDAEVGEYTGIFTAYMSTDADTNDAKTFKVVVLATEELAEQINASCHNKTAIVESMFTRFSLINPAAVNDSNYTAVQELMDQLNETFTALLAAMEAEDWTTANGLLSTLQADIDNAESGLADLELEQTMAWGGSWSGIWFWVIIVVVMVIVIGFVAYLFYPQKKGLGFTPPTQKKGFLDKLGGMFHSAKAKTKGVKAPKIRKKEEPEPESPPKYIEGYEKHGTGDFQYKKSIFKKIKEKFKKKKPQKDMSEFFSSSDSTERIVSDY